MSWSSDANGNGHGNGHPKSANRYGAYEKIQARVDPAFAYEIAKLHAKLIDLYPTVSDLAREIMYRGSLDLAREADSAALATRLEILDNAHTAQRHVESEIEAVRTLYDALRTVIQGGGDAEAIDDLVANARRLLPTLTAPRPRQQVQALLDTQNYGQLADQLYRNA